MAWKCPECGIQNEDAVKECACGYAFYKVLGVRPDASAESMKQTYGYLLNVWQKDFPNDPKAQKKADERLKKIKDAYEVSKVFSKGAFAPQKRINVKIAAAGAGAVLLLILFVVVLNISKEDKPPEQKPAITETKSPSKAAAQGEVKSIPQSQGETSQAKEQASLPQPAIPIPAMSSERNEGWAIETVKKSNILDKFFNVETLMKKWVDDNPGKFKVIGWQAKKMDEQIYVVSFTTSDGLAIKGFYFDVDTASGNVRHLANHPELQQKYGIQYSQ